MADFPIYCHIRYDVELNKNGNLELACTDVSDHDFVEVVRCRDCTNWDLDTHPSFIDGHFCPNIEFETEADFFCPDGKRRCKHDPNPSDPNKVP